MNNGRDCEHGSQLGKCYICDLVEAENRIAELEKTLAAVPRYHSDGYSDYVCTYCLSDDVHEDDCAAPKEKG